jgi:hypothetical protein
MVVQAARINRPAISAFASVALWTLVFPAVSAADPLGAGSGAIYMMTPAATYQEGCFPPCMCPILNEQPISGTFKLVYTGPSDGIETYAVQDVNLTVPFFDPQLRIIGGGKYSIGSPGIIPLLQQRMELDLQVGANAVEHFDSGWVLIGDMSRINVTVSINGMWCFDRVVAIDAVRVPDSAITPYMLGPGATYEMGCCSPLSPCDCLCFGPVPMVGDFALVPLSDNGLFRDFAVVNLNWQVPSTGPINGISIRGFGRYRVGGEVAVQHQLSLELWLSNTGPTHFDSGFVMGGGQFPVIDIFASMHGMNPGACDDTILHVLGQPVIGNAICGGIGGLPCPDGFFCKLPDGACCCDFMGVCASIPTGCPDVWDPVCGCDGVTYGNECEADRVGVTIAYRGECSEVCGGIAGIACPQGKFCKFPIGTCDIVDNQGMCAPIPDACITLWDPVCGCDGVTYGNECEADRAGVSIDHHGECVSAACAASRDLSDPNLSFCPGDPKMVRIVLTPPNSTTALGVEDLPPPGWIVTNNISHGGAYDPVNGKVKWGPLFAPFPPEVSYEIIPIPADSVTRCFYGSVSVDGNNQPICGEECVNEHCCSKMPADLPQEACSGCPVGGCDSCGGGTCDDGRVTLCEVIGYACSWIRGCNDDLSGMTRAAYVWRSGECYCWDDGQQKWSPTSCPAPESGCCPASNGGAAADDSIIPIEVPSTITVLHKISVRTWNIPVTVEPPIGTSAVAFEVQLPAGWVVTTISDDGAWDNVHRKIKWGPFFDDSARTVTFQVRPAVEPGGKTRTMRGGPRLRGVSGTVSFDGVNHPITVR